MRWLAAAFVLAACAPVVDPGFQRSTPPDPDPTPAPQDVLPDWWGWSDEPITSLTETEALGEDPGCVQALGGCADDYFALPDRWSEHVQPLSEPELQAALEEVFDGVAALDDPTLPGLLGGELADALNLGFLLDGLHARPLEVRTIGVAEVGDADELELLFVDPGVGTFRGLLRLPDGVDWQRPILGIHGHGTEAVDVFDVYGGDELVEAGHPVLALDLRVNYADDLEDEVQRALLRSGFSLLQVRIYEAFLGLKYLRGRGDMDTGFGLLGHSGGAAAMNVAIRLNPGVEAYASDNTADYDCLLDGERLLDDSVPALHPYRDLVNDFSTAEAAVYEADYGFPEGAGPLIQFF